MVEQIKIPITSKMPLRAKIRAFQQLFDREPQIFIIGTFDVKGKGTYDVFRKEQPVKACFENMVAVLYTKGEEYDKDVLVTYTPSDNIDLIDYKQPHLILK